MLVTITLATEDWEAIISAADCGLTDLDAAPHKRVARLLEVMEDQLAAERPA